MRPPHWALRLYSRLLGARTRRAIANPQAVQAALLARLVRHYAAIEVGRALGLSDVRSPEDFARRVPVTEEPFYRPFAEKVLAANPPDVVAPGRLRYLARTSGTTRISKYIPYPLPLIKAFKRFETKLAMHTMRDLGNYTLLSSNILITSGVPSYQTTAEGLIVGSSSGIMTLLAPAMAKEVVRPSRAVLEIPDWERKIEATVREALPLDIRVMTGIPVFAIPILERLLAYAAEIGRPAPNARALWPNLAVYYWSGSSIALYEARLRELFGPEVLFRELYSATEAPIAYQYRDGQPGLLLDLENTYFEFQPAEQPLESPRYGIAGVQPGVPYRIFVSTWGGLFAYRLGDLVEFLSLAPPLIRVLGRETEELNLASEKIQLHVLREALEATAADGGLSVRNFFICPTEPPAGVAVGYHWYVEFDRVPADRAAFAHALDERLKATHNYYRAIRQDDAVLGPCRLDVLPAGTIERHVLATRQFGQGKFVHLYATRDVPEQILAAPR